MMQAENETIAKLINQEGDLDLTDNSFRSFISRSGDGGVNQKGILDSVS